MNTGRRYGWKGDDGGVKTSKEKNNFAAEVLDPASRGELKSKHTSGIPKLAVRKHKGHGIRGEEDDLTEKDIDMEALAASRFEESDWNSFGNDENNLTLTLTKDISKSREKLSRGDNGSYPPSLSSSSGGMAHINDNIDKREVYTVAYENGRRPDYWREELYYDDNVLVEEHKAFVRELVGFDPKAAMEQIPLSAGGIEELDYSDFDFESLELYDSESEEFNDEESHAENNFNVESEGTAGENKTGDHKAQADELASERVAGDVENHDDEMDTPGKSRSRPPLDQKAVKRPDKTLCNAISPMKMPGPSGEDFWDNLMDHPTMYAEVRHYNEHPESKREPVPFFPKNRVSPAPEIVDFYMRWLYVTGLPPALSVGGMKHGVRTKLTSLQEQEIHGTVAKLLGVSMDQVFPANETSAFVGFESPESCEATLERVASRENTLTRPVSLASYKASSEDEKHSFTKGAPPDTIVSVDNLPPGRFSRYTLARDMFPEGSDLRADFSISLDEVVFRSPTSALIRLASADEAASLLSSEAMGARLGEIGSYPVRIFRARRELVHKGMVGPLKTYEIREPGPRLIVDGDMPSRGFYVSHAGVIMLQSLDIAGVSKESISDFFQPFSALFRDRKGSIEFVTCENRSPADRAYVGFERLGEAEAAVKTLKGRARIGDTIVTLRLVKDRKIPGAPPRLERPERTREEILKSLNDWEQYVDPEDIKYIEKHGVAKVVLDEALRGMRFQNRSFGSLDFAMRDEKLEPEKDSGDDYKELVQLYISTLKACVATPENPGEMYEALHFPGEPIDLSVFDREKKRQRALMKKRGL